MPVNPFLAVESVTPRPVRLRRSCLAVPGSNPRMMAKAAETEADQVFLDLEDAVAPAEKASARSKVVEALLAHDYTGKVVVVRVNDVTTPYLYADVIEVVRGAGDRIDCLMIPKVEDAGQVWFVEHLLSELEQDLGLGRRIGLELQIETGTGSVNMTEIARVTDRLETLIFGPGDFAAALGIPQLNVGELEPDYPGHQWHHILSQLVITARAVGRDAVDGPYSDFRDLDGFAESCRRARLLGLDGKWCIHPSQIAVANQTFTPDPAEVEHALEVLGAYEEALAEGRGAATLAGKMIDEASRKLAEKLVARGKAAGLVS